MANFEPIIQWVLYQEDSHKEPGKIVDEHDGAGFTRLGLTQRWHQNDLPMDFFSTMPFKQAVAAAKIVYRKQYWDLIEGDLIQYDMVAAPVLSFAVNDAVNIAVKTLQSVIEAVQDGKMGPHTIAELNSKDPMIVARLFRAEWADFYHRDVLLNPSKQKFLEGWINRANFPYPGTIPAIYQ